MRLCCILALAASVALSQGCSAPAQEESRSGSAIRLNQVGFLPDGPKVAVIASQQASDSFVVQTSTGLQVFAGRLSEPTRSVSTDESVRLADFSPISEPGTYQVVVEPLEASHPFDVRSDIYMDVATVTAKALYFNRASTALPEQYAGLWARRAGHPDTAVIVHPSAATSRRPAGTSVDSPGGWYDAGDYNKYVVPAAFTSYYLVAAFEAAPLTVEQIDLSIPESGDAVPDILDEAVWNLRWMLTMQDEDGGVYHKLTHAAFSGVVMPDAALADRYVVMKSTAASLTFAASMAQAARVLAEFRNELPGLADSCEAAAHFAWQWAVDNPDAYFRQGALNELYDPDLTTGAYGDDKLGDEWHWAGIELFLLTGDRTYYPVERPDQPETPYWQRSVSLLGDLSLARLAGETETGDQHSRIVVTVADAELAVQESSAYRVPVERDEDFYWGATGTAAAKAGVLLQAYRITGQSHYRDAAINMLDYLLGRNGTAYSFVTGLGERSPRHIHHRPSEADGVDQPVPGWLVGGPGAVGVQDCPEYPSDVRARHYLDAWCSYSTNEITTYWNAPLTYAAVMLQAGG
jgi:endoglucanase